MTRSTLKRKLVRPERVAASVHRIERLERRAMLSSSNVSFPNFNSISGFTANGFGSTAPNIGGQLIMTDSQLSEARSVYYNTPVSFERFSTHFEYLVDSANTPADGLTFALQEDGPSAVGDVGGSLGYQNMGSGHSAAVAIDLYATAFFVFSGNSFIPLNSGSPPGMPIDFLPFNPANGDTLGVTVSYDGTNLTTTITDAANPANTYTNSAAIDLTTVLGATTAYAGFTAATGASVSTQRVLDWTYAGTDGLTITAPSASGAGVSANVVSGTNASLSVTATDITSGGSLRYAWDIVHKPSGAADPTFDSNNSGAANNTVAHFHKAGTYVLRATATNANALSDTSNLTIVVAQNATAIRVTPHAQRIARNSTQPFKATVTDQFGKPMRSQPDIVWTMPDSLAGAVGRGGGSIGAASGLFTATLKKGHVILEATDTLDTLTGTVGATVV